MCANKREKNSIPVHSGKSILIEKHLHFYEEKL
jgi:hypothetical protein